MVGAGGKPPYWNNGSFWKGDSFPTAPSRISWAGWCQREDIFIRMNCSWTFPATAQVALQQSQGCYLTPPSASKHTQMKIKPLSEKAGAFRNEPEVGAGPVCSSLPAHGGDWEVVDSIQHTCSWVSGSVWTLNSGKEAVRLLPYIPPLSISYSENAN